ncbi:hypothetical protein [Alloyangia pacifica]|uniref:Uncharacterized protein n=1 Tax=Alloyangia pacifica TaxID=311180 RepID=A0A1I6PGG9_9RHOB|nr:hypothetical protein [Alloyangia pacifica]SDG26950.1 hypothetical protein SAMN04488245_102212 [Alloyangia pacifica]SFS39145.1 hypothetical protein SAMN04488050_101513 [Alloyangia pacifica]
MAEVRNFGTMKRLTLATAALSGLCSGALAEGARLNLDCSLVTVCSEAGICAAGEGPVAFTLAPLETDAAGAGDYEVSVDGAEALPAAALGFAGPFLWQPSEGTRMALSLTSETTALWTRQTTRSGTDAPPSAEIDFLTCRILP